MKTILFALTSHDRLGNTDQKTGFYVPELTHPWEVFHQAGYSIDFTSPKGGKPPMYGEDKNDPIQKKFFENVDMRRALEQTKRPVNCRPENYAAIYFVGGHGTMWDFPADIALASLAANIYEHGGIVSAVCHGPAALANLKLSDGSYLIKGKRVTAFTDDEERAVKLESVVPFLLASRLIERGAVYVPAPNWQVNVQTDGRLVTGQNPASAAGVANEVLRRLSA